MLLAAACVAWLLFFIFHISRAISVNHIVDRIASDTEVMINEMMPWPRGLSSMAAPDPVQSTTWETTVLSDVSGYIRFIDTGRLVVLAKSCRVKLRVLRRVGQFVPAGIPLVMVSKADRLPPDGSAKIREAFDFGPSRTLQQDVEFGVLQIVDIALKAISPAVNDPTTAISCVDQLSRILIRFVSREVPNSILYDPPGVFRVSISWITFEQLLDSAFEQIRLYSKADMAVSLRLLRALGDISTTTADQEIRRTLAERGRRIVAGCTKNLGEVELRPMLTRLVVLENSLNPTLAAEEAP
jgi:uncharacterized membrane protein